MVSNTPKRAKKKSKRGRKRNPKVCKGIQKSKSHNQSFYESVHMFQENGEIKGENNEAIAGAGIMARK